MFIARKSDSKDNTNYEKANNIDDDFSKANNDKNNNDINSDSKDNANNIDDDDDVVGVKFNVLKSTGKTIFVRLTCIRLKRYASLQA